MALTRLMVEAAFSEKIITSMHPDCSRLIKLTVRCPNATLETEKQNNIRLGLKQTKQTRREPGLFEEALVGEMTRELRPSDTLAHHAVEHSRRIHLLPIHSLKMYSRVSLDVPRSSNTFIGQHGRYHEFNVATLLSRESASWWHIVNVRVMVRVRVRETAHVGMFDLARQIKLLKQRTVHRLGNGSVNAKHLPGLDQCLVRDDARQLQRHERWDLQQ